MTLSSRFQELLKKNKLITKSDRVLVAFSGGKDSVCLLFLLHEVCKKFGFEVGACHVHHGIRGAEADGDLAFCESFCKQRDIPFFSEKVNAPDFSKKNKLGLEEGARILRYEVLERIAEEEGYHKIATAHTASDQAETVLFHLIRGSGFHGMNGISECRGKIIRPLLSFYQDEILEFLDNLHITFKEDSSNRDMIYSRNRLRGSILPEMKEINPSVEKSFTRFADIANEQSRLVGYLCDRWEQENGVDCASGTVFIEKLQGLTSEAELAPVFYEALSRMAAKEKIVIDYRHFKSLSALLKRPNEGKIIEIANGFVFQVESGKLFFGKNERDREHINYQVKLSSGDNPLPIPLTILHVSDKKQGKVENINKNLLIIHVAFDKIEGDLFVRNRREGDTVRIGGMTKSVKKLFQEAKIPREYRDLLPLVCDDGGIVWIPYIGLCDRVRESECGEIFTMSLRSSYLPEAE